jgi:hypothetical protein
MSAFRLASASFLICCLLFLAGCSGGDGPRVKLSGTVVKDGAPIQVKSGDMLNISFQSKAGDSAVHPATLAADGSFTVDGPGKKGIPPGKYTLIISLTSGGSDPASLQHMDQLNKQFAAVKGKEFEVGSEPDQKITIDVTRGTVGK